MIYLDNAGTTKMFEECLAVMEKYACHSFFNPSAGYEPAIRVSQDLEGVRKLILNKLGATKGDVFFTSGATESNNLAIMGSRKNGKWNYVFSMGEHPSVYNVAKELAMQGFEVRFVKLDNNGQINYSELEKCLDEKTRLISIMYVSNETGAINDIERVNELRKKYSPKALLQVDGVQAFCKIGIDVEKCGVDFYTISAHKFHGPKGVGALYVKNPQCLKNIIYGGGQEKGLRSGTENVAGIMGMKEAIEHIDENKNFKHVCNLKKVLCETLSKDERIKILDVGSPYILGASMLGVNGETLMRVLQDKGVLIGKGSACSTKKAGNRVLESIGLNNEEIKSHIRISFGGYETEDEIKNAGEIILKTYQEIWEKVK